MNSCEEDWLYLECGELQRAWDQDPRNNYKPSVRFITEYFPSVTHYWFVPYFLDTVVVVYGPNQGDIIRDVLAVNGASLKPFTKESYREFTGNSKTHKIVIQAYSQHIELVRTFIKEVAVENDSLLS